jgi:hypothetical protein
MGGRVWTDNRETDIRETDNLKNVLYTAPNEKWNCNLFNFICSYPCIKEYLCYVTNQQMHLNKASEV